MTVTDQLTSNKDASLTCVNGLNIVTVKERQKEPRKMVVQEDSFGCGPRGHRWPLQTGERNRFTSCIFQTGRHFTSSLTSGLEDCPGFLIPGAIHREDMTGDAFNH